jgi:hypothetical protein
MSLNETAFLSILYVLSGVSTGEQTVSPCHCLWQWQFCKYKKSSTKTASPSKIAGPTSLPLLFQITIASNGGLCQCPLMKQRFLPFLYVLSGVSTGEQTTSLCHCLWQWQFCKYKKSSIETASLSKIAGPTSLPSSFKSPS